MGCVLELKDIEKSFPGAKTLDGMKIFLKEVFYMA